MMARPQRQLQYGDNAPELAHADGRGSASPYTEYSTLPEVASGFGTAGGNSDSLPQVRDPEAEKMLVSPGAGGFPVYPASAPTRHGYGNVNGTGNGGTGAAEMNDGYGNGNENGGYDLGQHGVAAASEARPNWFRRQRKRVLVGIAAVILLIIIGVVVGVVVSRKSSSSNNNSSGSGSTSESKNGTNTTPNPSDPSAPFSSGPTPFGIPTTFPDAPNGQTLLSTCAGTICPQLLASASYGSPTAPTTFIFTRGSDNAIWYRSFTNHTWSQPWTSLGGSFLAQPTAASMRDGRVDVFGVWAENQMAKYKTFQNGVWDSEWTGMNGILSSVVSVCSRGQDYLNVVHLDAENGVWHKYISDGSKWQPQKWEGQGGYASSTVDLGCVSAPGGGRADMVAFGKGTGGKGYGMTYRRMNATGSWGGWANATGEFKGDPTVLSTAARAEYFGVAVDGTLRYRSWIAESNTMTEEVDLGGKFQSAVSVFATGNRVDVVGVGPDARVWHKARIGQTWGTAWESLGGWFNSAPRAVVTGEGQAVVFGLGPNGTIIHAMIEIGVNYNWGQRQWFTDGGSMSAKWFRLGPA